MRTWTGGLSEMNVLRSITDGLKLSSGLAKQGATPHASPNPNSAVVHHSRNTAPLSELWPLVP